MLDSLLADVNGGMHSGMPSSYVWLYNIQCKFVKMKTTMTQDQSMKSV